MAISSPLVVVGSVNADIYVEVDRLPSEGETIAATSGQTLPGGKGANQAACAARLAYPTYFCGQVGDDANASLVKEALASAGVSLDHVNTVNAPTGHAVVMLQPGGKNTIIIVGGANVAWPTLKDHGDCRLTTDAQQLIKQAGAVLLQREIPDAVNLEAAKIAKSANVPVIMDVGGAEGPIAKELLECVTVLSPNESELRRLTGMPTDSVDQILQAAAKVQEMGVTQVLVKLGENGSLLVRDQEPPLFQPAILVPTVVDTTGAGDTFTAAYAVAIIERQPPEEALRFAAASASICVGAKGASPSILGREAVLQLLKEHHPEVVDQVSFSSSSSKQKDLRVGRSTRAFLSRRTRSPRSSPLHVRGLYVESSGYSQRVAESCLIKNKTRLSGGASQFKLPCEVLSHKFCPAKFGVFAL